MAHGRKEEKRMKWILGCSEEGELRGKRVWREIKGEGQLRG